MISPNEKKRQEIQQSKSVLLFEIKYNKLLLLCPSRLGAHRVSRDVTSIHVYVMFITSLTNV